MVWLGRDHLVEQGQRLFVQLQVLEAFGIAENQFDRPAMGKGAFQQHTGGRMLLLLAAQQAEQVQDVRRLRMAGLQQGVVGDGGFVQQIGSASCRERVCQYGSISVVAVSLKQKKTDDQRKKYTRI